MSKRVEGKAYKSTEREREKAPRVPYSGADCREVKHPMMSRKKRHLVPTHHTYQRSLAFRSSGDHPPESFNDTCRQKETTFCKPESSGLNYRNGQRRQSEETRAIG